MIRRSWPGRTADACGTGGDPAAVAAWSEQLGRTIKAVDPHHLYEDGAFAGRIAAHAASPVGMDAYATPSVDIVGDALALNGDPAAARMAVGETADAVRKSERVYVLDSYGWSPTLWKTNADLASWLSSIARTRDVSGAIAGNLQGHADQGGYLPAQPAAGPGLASLYFPGTPADGMDLPTDAGTRAGAAPVQLRDGGYHLHAGLRPAAAAAGAQRHAWPRGLARFGRCGDVFDRAVTRSGEPGDLGHAMRCLRG